MDTTDKKGSEILLVEVLNYHETPPSVFARFWWSESLGVTCDQVDLFTALKQSGITVPGVPIIYPKDGRAFFDQLPFRFDGLLSAQAPITTNLQLGQA